MRTVQHVRAPANQSPLVTGGTVHPSPFSATGPQVTPSAWNGGSSASAGGGMLDELGMSGGGASGYVEFGDQSRERRAAPTPPPRNASAKKTQERHA